MPDSDLPKGTASSEPLTLEEGEAALEDLLSPPDEEPAEDQVQEADDSEEEESDDAENTEEADEEAEESDDQQDDDEESEVFELTDDLEIDLGDGQRATLAQLKADYGQVQKRVADFQRDYTHKSNENAQIRQELEVQGQRVIEQAQKVRQDQELVLRVMADMVGKPPEVPQIDASIDPDAWADYTQKKAQYDARFSQFGQLYDRTQREVHEQQQRAHAQHQQAVQAEWDKLLEVRPELGDPQKLQEANRDITEQILKRYGFSSEEFATVFDHRTRQAMLDLAAFHKKVASVPKAKQKVTGKPKMLRPGKATSQQDKSSSAHKKKIERLRLNPGDLTAAADLLMDYDL